MRVCVCMSVCVCDRMCTSMPAYTQDMTSYTTVCTCRTVPYELSGAVQT